MGFFVGESAARRPRGIVKLNGTPIAGWSKFSVSTNTFSAADTFSAEFVVSALPAEKGALWFSEQTDMYVELFAGFPEDPTTGSYFASDLESLIYGQVDDVSYDPERRVIGVHGRDLTRLFIDTKTTQKWPNLTASQIATQLAQSHGLTPVVTATTAKAGKFYQIDYVNLADERTEWDILCYLARAENYRVYVKGQSLYFEPYPSDDSADTFVPPWPVNWVPDDTPSGPPAANIIRPRFRRALTVSRGIQVVVRAWDKARGKAFNSTYPTNKATTLKPGQSSTSSQVYHLTRGDMTQEKAAKLAKDFYDQQIQHEMHLDFEAPADNDLDITRYIQVSGTGTAFDQIYYPDSIDREMSVDGGYAMSVHAKNTSPELQVNA